MKISLYVQASDLIPMKKTLLEKLNNFFIKDSKHAMFQTQPTEHILKTLKTSGVDGLELIFPLNCSAENIQKVKGIIKKNEMQIFSIHQSNDNSFKIDIEQIQNLCQIANSFSANIITLHIDSLGKKIFDKTFIEKLKMLQKKYVIKFAIENMPKSIFTFSKAYTYKANEFSSVIAKTGLGITLDTTHSAQAGEDICEFYIKNKEKIINIHLSDYRRHWFNKKLLLANNTHLPLSKGELQITEFLKLLKKNNYHGLTTMEISSDLKGLLASARMIKMTVGE